MINKVRNPDPPYFRPNSLLSGEVDTHKVEEKTLQCYKDLMEFCWVEEAFLRPSFTYIKQEMTKLHQGK